jgi:hypothetical protein
MYYLLSTKTGWFNTTDEKLASEGYTIEKLIDEMKDDPINKLLFVNRKPANTREYKYEDYWEFGEYVGNA